MGAKRGHPQHQHASIFEACAAKIRRIPAPPEKIKNHVNRPPPPSAVLKSGPLSIRGTISLRLTRRRFASVFHPKTDDAAERDSEISRPRARGLWISLDPILFICLCKVDGIWNSVIRTIFDRVLSDRAVPKHRFSLPQTEWSPSRSWNFARYVSPR